MSDRALLRHLINLTEQREHGQPVIDIGRECFGLADGSVLNWRGQNYTPQCASLRVRLHNWLVSLDNRTDESDGVLLSQPKQEKP